MIKKVLPPKQALQGLIKSVYVAAFHENYEKINQKSTEVLKRHF